MKHRSIFAVAAAAAFTLLLACPSARADEEEFAGWREVRIAAKAGEDIGDVLFVADVDDREYRRVVIKAFEREFTLSPEELARLGGFPLDSLRITYSAGYPGTGGPGVYFRLQNVHYVDKTLVADQVTISVTKGKGMAVREPVREVVKPAPAKD